MAFRVGNKTMAPGSYDLRLAKGAASQILVIYNQTDNSAAALVAAVGDPSKASRATVTFECTDGTCSLRKLSDGSGAVAYQFPAQKAPGTLSAHRTELVTLTMIKSH